MSPITTHILDTGSGRPAQGVRTTLSYFNDQGEWEDLSTRHTNEDGRIPDLIDEDMEFHSGVYRLSFDTGGYFDSRNEASFYPEVSILFQVKDPSEHYHVPLLLNRYGYSTYRGS